MGKSGVLKNVLKPVLQGKGVGWFAVLANIHSANTPTTAISQNIKICFGEQYKMAIGYHWIYSNVLNFLKMKFKKEKIF